MSPYETKSTPVFCGTIVDQYLASTENDDVQVILTVEVNGTLSDPSDRASAVEGCPSVERVVRLTITHDEAGDTRTRIAVQNLARLGFTGTDLSRLHPDHADPHDLIGQEVFLRARERDEITYWNLAWPGARPRPVSLDRLVEQADAFSTRIGRFQSEDSLDRRARDGA